MAGRSKDQKGEGGILRHGEEAAGVGRMRTEEEVRKKRK